MDKLFELLRDYCKHAGRFEELKTAMQQAGLGFILYEDKKTSKVSSKFNGNDASNFLKKRQQILDCFKDLPRIGDFQQLFDSFTALNTLLQAASLTPAEQTTLISNAKKFCKAFISKFGAR